MSGLTLPTEREHPFDPPATIMERRDHHDWGSEAYVDAWITRQQAEDPVRAQQFQLLCDLLPFPTDATVTILDVGAGYGPVSKFILDRYCVS